MNKYKKHAFTLIELLVVIVIIGILSGMSIAQFRATIEKARLAKAQAAAAQFKRQALAQNAIFGDSLFTAWYTFDNGTVNPGNPTNSETAGIRDTASGQNHLLNNSNLTSSAINTAYPNSDVLDVNNRTAYRSNSAISINNPEDKITIATWVKMNDLNPPNYPVFLAKGGYAGMRIHKINKSIQFYLNATSGSTRELLSSDNNIIDANQWHFVVASYGNGIMRLWIDGELTAENTSATLYNNFNTGGNITVGNTSFSGYLEDVMITSYTWNGEEFE